MWSTICIFSLVFINVVRGATDAILIPEGQSVIEDQYIVILKPSYKPQFQQHLSSVREILKNDTDCKIKHYQTDSMLAYSAKMSQAHLDKVKRMDEVESIEADSVVKLSAFQEDAPYHLARLTHARTGGDNYEYDVNGGLGVTVYVVDSGIDITHREFEGRATWGANYARNSPNRDDIGHGTHVAGIIGSRTYGVAKAVKMVAVKVFGADGTTENSDIIAGLEWVMQSASNGVNKVINLSFSGSFSLALNSAVEGAVSQGFTVVVASGNSRSDACRFSPASARGIISVGATTATDSKASYSNFGRCLTIFAPGDDITSTWPGQSTHNLSGTSMASPFVAGLAALVLGKSSMSPSQVMRQIVSSGLRNIVTNAGADSPNVLTHYSP